MDVNTYDNKCNKNDVYNIFINFTFLVTLFTYDNKCNKNDVHNIFINFSFLKLGFHYELT